jgi:hypothetical protein
MSQETGASFKTSWISIRSGNIYQLYSPDLLGLLLFLLSDRLSFAFSDVPSHRFFKRIVGAFFLSVASSYSLPGFLSDHFPQIL